MKAGAASAPISLQKRKPPSASAKLSDLRRQGKAIQAEAIAAWSLCWLQAKKKKNRGGREKNEGLYQSGGAKCHPESASLNWEKAAAA